MDLGKGEQQEIKCATTRPVVRAINMRTSFAISAATNGRYTVCTMPRVHISKDDGWVAVEHKWA